MLIGIGGQADSGKSVTAGFLEDRLNFKEYSFARNLKSMCMKVFKLTEDDVFTQEGKEKLFVVPVELTIEHLKQIDDWIKKVTPEIEVDPEGLTKATLYCLSEKKPKFANARQILQYVGTEICRQCYSQSYHIDVVRAEIDKTHPVNVVISDARFQNERDAVNDWGGHTVYVKNMEGVEKIAGIEGHGSEAEMDEDKYDYVLENYKTKGKDYFYGKIENLYNSIKLERGYLRREEPTQE